MAPDPRVAKAFSAMRGLGIVAETVKPVLKELLKLYNRNWELIEADNYHTLVEAIFELEDDNKVYSFISVRYLMRLANERKMLC